MLAFEVQDMSCNHCVGAITRAVKEVDAGATVSVDLGSKLVRVQPATADAQTLRDAIAEAGYTPVPVDAPAA